MVQDSTVNEKDLLRALNGLRNVMALHVERKGDPWAFRQALVIVLELDTAAALERGVDIRVLNSFDVTVRADARAWAQRRS